MFPSFLRIYTTRTRLPSSYIIALIFRRTEGARRCRIFPGPDNERGIAEELGTASRPGTYVHRATARKSKRILQRGRDATGSPCAPTRARDKCTHVRVFARSPRKWNFPFLSPSLVLSLVPSAHPRVFFSRDLEN